MRSTSRIPEILVTLEGLWQRYPDLRLGQLIANLTPRGQDLFYTEDDDLQLRMKRVISDGWRELIQSDHE